MKPDEKNKLLRIANSFNLSSSQQGLLQDYVRLLQEWNYRVNLVSSGDLSRLVDKHIAESLWFCHDLVVGEASTVLDLGSGGGFPGIPMKIAKSGLSIVLLESRRNKVLFLREAVERLGLERVRVICARAESLPGADRTFQPVELVVCRAVATLVKLARWGMPLLAPHGRIAALKGGDIAAELADLRAENPSSAIEVMSIDARFGPTAADRTNKQMVMIRSSNP